MTKQQKLIEKLLHNESNFKWTELVALLESLGYTQVQGKGSRVKFDIGDAKLLINLHKPHPDNFLKQYARQQVITKLKDGGLI